MDRETAWEGFAKAIEGHPFTTIEELKCDVDEGRATVVMGENSAVVIRWHFAVGVAECAPATGDPDEIVRDLRPVIEETCADYGISEIYIQAGRGAWSRLLRKHGYEEVAVILRKVLRQSGPFN